MQSSQLYQLVPATPVMQSGELHQPFHDPPSAPLSLGGGVQSGQRHQLVHDPPSAPLSLGGGVQSNQGHQLVHDPPSAPVSQEGGVIGQLDKISEVSFQTFFIWLHCDKQVQTSVAHLVLALYVNFDVVIVLHMFDVSAIIIFKVLLKILSLSFHT